MGAQAGFKRLPQPPSAMGSAGSIASKAWFQRDFGFIEDNYASTQSRFKYDRSKGELISTEKEGRVFLAGEFETPSLKELRSRAIDARHASKGKLLVTEIVEDVSDLHTLPENKLALFQAASQFNCLEHTSERGLPQDGIACYACDCTQGPACAVACAPGTIVRNYFAFEAMGGKGPTPGQTSENQVQNLRDVESVLENQKHAYFSVKNGYTLASDKSLKPLKEVLNSSLTKRDAVMDSLRIGLQWDTEVISSRFGEREYKRPQQLVTQAYCSAISVSYSGCAEGSWEPLARLILAAAYEATLCAAVLNATKHKGKPGAKRVFLTALGGGVFGNPTSWIVDAMDRAFRKFKDCDLEVCIVSFRASVPEFAALAGQFS